jgi:hypothetical protein
MSSKQTPSTSKDFTEVKFGLHQNGVYSEPTKRNVTQTSDIMPTSSGDGNRYASRINSQAHRNSTLDNVEVNSFTEGFVTKKSSYSSVPMNLVRLVVTLVFIIIILFFYFCFSRSYLSTATSYFLATDLILEV